MKVFYAHGYHETPTEIEEAARRLLETLQARSDKTVRVRTGRSDHTANWKGDWDAWEHNVVHKKNLTTGKPMYDIFVTSGDKVGRATARILNMALDVGKPVFWWGGEIGKGIVKVVGVEEVDAEDWTWGWQVRRKERPASPGTQMNLPLQETTT
tara:strand:- start:6 stop:467 length:462 start_codon:yes stop_codon:yes gene_type:complete